MKTTYLDWAATAGLDRNILEKSFKANIKYYANPSSPHKDGKETRKYINQCRKQLSELLGIDSSLLYFTSSGTESNNIIISSLLNKRKLGNCVISSIEHSSVYEPIKYLEKIGWEIREIKPDNNGQISPEVFVSAIDDNTKFASIMMINNEVGTVQPVKEIGKLLAEHKKRSRIHYHIDAVQAVCKINFSISETRADSIAISSHKFQGPKGAGLLYLKKTIEPVFRGGGQENNIRSGTENIFAISGTLFAAQKAMQNLENNLSQALNLKKELISQLVKIKGLEFNPKVSTEQLLDPSLFSPYILSLNIKPIPGEILVRLMSDKGFDISTGAACSSGKKAHNRVLESFNISKDDAYSSIRISTGCSTQKEDITSFCNTLANEVSFLRKSL